MAKEDFKEKIEELNRIGIVRVCTDFHHAPNSHLFVKSLATNDKNWSIKLYPATNTFCDYANGNKGGDIIRFIAYIQNINNWQALKLLQEYYGLSDDQEKNKEEVKKRIQQQQEEQKRTQERHQAFYTALFGCIDDLKKQEQNYKDILENKEIQPFSDVWCYAMEQLQSLGYRLNILCSIPSNEYRRMKPDATRGISSDRLAWLIDVLSILEADGIFKATEDEIREIQAQKDFESNRKPGKNRICSILW